MGTIITQQLAIFLTKKRAYWSFFRIKSLKTPIITYICGIYKFRYAKNAFSVARKM